MHFHTHTKFVNQLLIQPNKYLNRPYD
jgi:hypothetical protein